MTNELQTYLQRLRAVGAGQRRLERARRRRDADGRRSSPTRWGATACPSATRIPSATAFGTTSRCSSAPSASSRRRPPRRAERIRSRSHVLHECTGCPVTRCRAARARRRCGRLATVVALTRRSSCPRSRPAAAQPRRATRQPAPAPAQPRRRPGPRRVLTLDDALALAGARNEQVEIAQAGVRARAGGNQLRVAQREVAAADRLGARTTARCSRSSPASSTRPGRLHAAHGQPARAARRSRHRDRARAHRLPALVEPVRRRRQRRRRRRAAVRPAEHLSARARVLAGALHRRAHSRAGASGARWRRSTPI